MKCSSSGCSEDAVVHVLEVRNRRALTSGQLFCERHANLVWDSYVADSRPGTGAHHDATDVASFELDLILAYNRKDLHRVLLRQVGSMRVFALPVHYPDVCTLYQVVQESPYNEGKLHIALAKIVQQLGADLSHVLMDDFHDSGYLVGKVVVVHKKDVIAVQIRPSDALALAILTNIPFLVAEKALTKMANHREPL